MGGRDVHVQCLKVFNSVLRHGVFRFVKHAPPGSGQREGQAWGVQKVEKKNKQEL
jgi:hypothetical protein